MDQIDAAAASVLSLAWDQWSDNLRSAAFRGRVEKCMSGSRRRGLQRASEPCLKGSAAAPALPVLGFGRRVPAVVLEHDPVARGRQPVAAARPAGRSYHRKSRRACAMDICLSSRHGDHSPPDWSPRDARIVNAIPAVWPPGQVSGQPSTY